MFLRKEFEKRIERKLEEIAALEKQLAEARSYLLALEDSMKILSRAGDAAGGEAVLRPGTDLAKARDYLRKVGKAVHVTKIIEGIGKEVNKETRVSLSGSLSNYVRKGLIFTRPAPNTFGLVEFGESEGTADDDDPPLGPPDGFGEEEAEDVVEEAPVVPKAVPTKPTASNAPCAEADEIPF